MHHPTRGGPRPPAGLVGGLAGALGALPLVPLAGGLAARIVALPSLPGAELRSNDIKAATYAEAAVLIGILPIAAVLFGCLLPRYFESRAKTGRISFEWAALGFAASFLLCQRGLRPKYAMIAGLAAYVVLVAGIFRFRASPSFRRLFARPNRLAGLRIFAAGASLDLARRAQGAGGLRDLPAELALAGTCLVGAVLLISVLRSRRRDLLLRRYGRLSWMVIALSAALIAVDALPPILPVAILVVFLGAPLVTRIELDRRIPQRVSLVLLLLACGWRIYWSPGSAVELFEDGCSLSFAQAYREGARPYVDTYPLHGWGADGGVDGFVFRAIGPSLHGFRVRQASWALLALGLLAVAAAALFGSLWWSGLAFLFSLSIARVVTERHMLALAALLFLILGAKSRNRWKLAMAGVFTGWALLHSLDFGMILIGGGLGGLLLLPVLEARLRLHHFTPRPAFHFLLGVAIGSLPFLAILAAKNGLGSFWRISFWEIPRWVDAAWGLPVASFWPSIRNATALDAMISLLSNGPAASLFPLLIVAAGLSLILFRAAAGQLDGIDRAAWLSLAISAAAMRVVLGRADDPHLMRYGLFVGLAAAWLVYRTWHGVTSRVSMTLAITAVFLLRLHPVRVLEEELAWVASDARQERTALSEGERWSDTMLPRVQAKELLALKTYMDARLARGKTFFDFSNEPALYFLLDRVLPIRYHTVAQYESVEKQLEVIAALERVRPPLAIVAFAPYDRLDGIPNAERAPLVAHYLTSHYQVEAVIAGRSISSRTE